MILTYIGTCPLIHYKVHSVLATTTTSYTRLRVFLAPLTYMPTHIQCHSSTHVCCDHTLYHIINTFINRHQYNSFHQQFNPSPTHHAYLIQHIINSLFTSCSIHHQFIIHIILTNHELSHSSSKHHETFHKKISHNIQH